MNNLYMALMEKGIKPEQSAKALSDVLHRNERTIRNKLNGTSDFTISEAVTINSKLFDNKYEIGYLFQRDNQKAS